MMDHQDQQEYNNFTINSQQLENSKAYMNCVTLKY